MPALGTASTATSTPFGRSAMAPRHGRPPISLRLRLTRWMSPRYANRCRFASTAPPSEPGSGDTPTMATDRGRMSRATAPRRSSAVTLVGSESRPIGLVVEELRHAPVATLLGIEEARLVDLGEQVVLGVVPRHVEHAPVGVLGGLQRRRVLLHQDLGKLHGARAQALAR